MIKRLLLLLGLLSALFFSQAQDSTYQVRVMQYNLMAFGLSSGNGCSFDVGRYATLGTVLDHYRPHLLAVNEIGPSELYRQNILRESMKYPNDMEAAPLVVERQSDRTSLLYYDSALFGYLGTLPCPDDDCVLSSSGVRDILVYELYFKPSVRAGQDTTFLNLIVCHLKAGDGSSNENQRQQSAQEIVNWIGSRRPGQNVMVLGDLNISFGGEATWQTLVASGNAPLRDPINLVNGWSGPGNAIAHTQSTRSSSSGCFVGGGLDDRFDFILPTPPLLDGTLGAQIQSGSYQALGNDGSFFNQSIGCASGLPTNVCQALFNTSDHLPLTLTLEMQGQTTTGLPDWTRALRVGPQPMETELRVQVPPATGQPGWQLSLSDLLGRPLWQGSGAPDWRVETATWPAGVYQLRLTDPQGRAWQQKLLKH